MPSILDQMYTAQKSRPQSALDKLKSYFSPTSTAGQVDMHSLYSQYMQKASTSEDESPMTFEDFVKAWQAKGTQ